MSDRIIDIIEDSNTIRCPKCGRLIPIREIAYVGNTLEELILFTTVCPECKEEWIPPRDLEDRDAS
jgi:predicted RNA-binding Zn-ribbon protein involved in translation (DUF1610 family)